MKDAELLDVAEILQNRYCVCGKSKEKGKAVCRSCWQRLSPRERRSLFFEDGFLEAYKSIIPKLDPIEHFDL